MEIVRTVRPQNGMAELRIWRCASSNIVHMKVGPLVVNFDPGEFNRFAESVIDVNYTESLTFAITTLNRNLSSIK